MIKVNGGKRKEGGLAANLKIGTPDRNGLEYLKTPEREKRNQRKKKLELN